MTEPTATESVRADVLQFRDKISWMRSEIGKVIIGNKEVVDGVLVCLLAGGHALLEGVPGLGKTMLVRTLAETLSLQFSRIQFTPDLMPADILGTNMIVEDEAGRREFQFQKGPIFTQICLFFLMIRPPP